MKVIADLQLHSKYSRAVSQKMNIEELFFWSQMKGIGLIATGDWTHPLWIREIKEKLEETGRGTLALKQDIVLKLSSSNIQLSNKTQSPNHPITQSTEFLLATEISSIYSQAASPQEKAYPYPQETRRCQK